MGILTIDINRRNGKITFFCDHIKSDPNCQLCEGCGDAISMRIGKLFENDAKGELS